MQMSENYSPNGQDLDRDVAKSVQKPSRRSEQRLKKVVETWQNPIAPKLSFTLTICLGLLTLAMGAVEIKHYILSGANDLIVLWENLSITLLGLWSVITPFIILCALSDMHGNKKRLLKRKAASGIVDDTEEARARTRRAIRRQSKPCILRMKAVCLGWAIIIILAILLHVL